MDPFTRHGLPSNSALASLPPLPKTPFLPRSETSNDRDSAPSYTARTPSHGSAAHGEDHIPPPWRETVYPILTARPGGMNFPRPKPAGTPGPVGAAVGARREWKTPSRSASAASKSDEHAELVVAPSTHAVPNSPPETVKRVPVPFDSFEADPSASYAASPDSIHERMASSTPLRPARGVDPQSAAKVHAETPRTGGMMRSAALRSMRDFNLSLEGSPIKPASGPAQTLGCNEPIVEINDLSTDTKAEAVIEAPLDQSTLLPSSPRKWAGKMDGSLLFHETLPTAPSPPRPTTASVARTALDQSTLLPESPHKWMQLDQSLLFTETLHRPASSLDTLPAPVSEVAANALDQSTLLPRSPHKWMQADQTMLMAEPLPSGGLGDMSRLDQSLLLPTSPRLRGDRSLARPGQSRPMSRAQDAEQSVIFPVSPRRTTVDDQSMLMAETMDFDDKSMRLTLPRHVLEKTPKRGPLLADMFVPLKGEGTGLGKEKPVRSRADETLDLGAMMEKLKKPKRPSGTEESFADLLHGDLSGEMDA